MFSLHSFPPYPYASNTVATTPIAGDLPAPVLRFYTKLFGDHVPIVDTAVVSGRGTIRFKGITFPSRWRFIYCAGSAYRHYMETTVLGRPLMKVNEYFINGHSRLELPFGVVENQPKVDMAANLGLWGESIWFPSIFLTDSRVRWEAIDGNSARLIVPFGDTTDQFFVTFDPTTGLLQRLEAQRYRDAADTQKLGWRNEAWNWKSFKGMLLPSQASVRWLDQSSPWFVLSVEEVVYNIDVDTYIRTRDI